jgi:capsular polysaccharide export protein
LTTDLAGQGGDEPSCFARRTRRLTLDELVAGTLQRYPLYWDHQLKGVTTCMAVLRRIQTQRDTLLAEGVLQHLKDGYVRRLFRKLIQLLKPFSTKL